MIPLDNERSCEGVVECTALVLAEGCTELEDKLTLFGILDELRPSGGGDTSFVVYAKFEGCEHASDSDPRMARILITDEDGVIIDESEEFSAWLDGPENSTTVVSGFGIPDDFGEGGGRVLWVEAILDDEALAQTAVRLREPYNV
ncbi:MAG: hypothetical protein M3338_04610 [Actinomycetota bacterium]|nr:hypothetical protein [Actinomycetota bacterium]